jgi:hypothetical protein
MLILPFLSVGLVGFVFVFVRIVSFSLSLSLSLSLSTSLSLSLSSKESIESKESKGNDGFPSSKNVLVGEMDDGALAVEWV